MADRAAPGDVLGPLIGSGKVAEVFGFGEGVAKIYRSPAGKLSAFREAAALALVQSLALPSPTVHGVRSFGERWGIIMDRVEGRILGDSIRRPQDEVADLLADMARLHRRVHACPGLNLGSLSARLEANIVAVHHLGPVRQRRLRDGLAGLPSGDRLCHGDFHPWNIIVQPSGDPMLVDWLDARCGEPAADVCRSYVLMHPHVPAFASAYVDAYAGVSGGSRGAILEWLPFVAAARLAEDVPDEVDGLMAMVDTL